MKPFSDTSPEAERSVIESYRQMSFAQKWRLMGQIFRTAKRLHAMGVKMRNSSATDDEIRDDWIVISLGEQEVNLLRH